MSKEEENNVVIKADNTNTVNVVNKHVFCEILGVTSIGEAINSKEQPILD